MSLIYLKSSKYIKDINNRKIPESGELPYHFTNFFKEPINITPKSKIELISADLNIENVHEILGNNLNDSFVFGFGTELDSDFSGDIGRNFFQTPVQLVDGRYTNTLLANEIRRQYENNVLLDNMKFNFVYDSRNNQFKYGFTIEDYSNERNQYTLLAQKMGFNEPDSSLNTGIGTRTSQTVSISNNEQQTVLTDDGFNLTNNSLLDDTSTPVNTNLPVNMISNLVTPNSEGSGVNNFDGNLCAVFQPCKMSIFPNNWQTSLSGKAFSATINSASSDITFTAPTNDAYDFKITGVNNNNYNCKLVQNQSQYDAGTNIGFTYNSANNITMKKLPVGQLLIINDVTNKATPDSVLTNNEVVLIYGIGWSIFFTQPSLNITQFLIDDNDANDFYELHNVVSMGFYSSGGIALSRGECCMLGTNQMNNTNKYTRARVENMQHSFGIEVDSKIYADYSFQLTPTTSGTDTYVSIRVGTQTDDTVAGEVNWMTVPNMSSNNSKVISTYLNTLDPKHDNVLLVAQVKDYKNVEFMIAHDNKGDCEFDNFKTIGSTVSPESLGGESPLRINFTQASYPIMPIVANSTGYGYTAWGQETIVTGRYSKFIAKNKNLQTVRNNVLNNFGQAYNIPIRQPQSSENEEFGNLNDFTENVVVPFKRFLDENEIHGNNPSTGVKTIEIPNNTPKTTDGIKEYQNTSQSPFLIRFGRVDDEDKKLLVDDGLKIEPDLTTYLNVNIGEGENMLSYNEANDIFTTNNPQSNLNSNYIVNIENLGNIKGQNSANNTISRMLAVIPSSELIDGDKSGHKHWVSQYPNPVHINAKSDEKVNNFLVNITDDEGIMAEDLRHPINLLCKITD